MMLQYLKYVHGSFNAVMMILFFYQGSLGLRIRRARRKKALFPMAAISRHRRNGPVLKNLGLIGFLSGLALVLIDSGRVFEFPLHLITGLTIVVLLISTYLVSRKIKGPASPLRTPHFVLGTCILSLYVFQSFLGLKILW
jgi:hypothetical protein